MEAKHKLKKTIEQRNEGFVTNENPIIGDVYALKLNMLGNMRELA